jgi:hypothetical protein
VVPGGVHIAEAPSWSDRGPSVAVNLVWRTLLLVRVNQCRVYQLPQRTFGLARESLSDVVGDFQVLDGYLRLQAPLMRCTHVFSRQGWVTCYHTLAAQTCLRPTSRGQVITATLHACPIR